MHLKICPVFILFVVQHLVLRASWRVLSSDLCVSSYKILCWISLCTSDKDLEVTQGVTNFIVRINVLESNN